MFNFVKAALCGIIGGLILMMMIDLHTIGTYLDKMEEHLVVQDQRISQMEMLIGIENPR